MNFLEGVVVGLSLLLFNGITAVLGPFGAFLCATACGWLLLLMELLLLRQSHAIYAKMLQLIGLERLADVSSMTVLTPARHLLVMLSSRALLLTHHSSSPCFPLTSLLVLSLLFAANQVALRDLHSASRRLRAFGQGELAARVLRQGEASKQAFDILHSALRMQRVLQQTKDSAGGSVLWAKSRAAGKATAAAAAAAQQQQQ